MPCSSLYASWIARRRFVSSMAAAIACVRLSAYITTRPLTWRAARPIVWISAVWPRRKPSLSASRMATSETSGRSRPSRRRLTPTSTSYSPSRSCADDLDALERVDLGVQVARADARLDQVVGQVLGHLLRQRRDQHALAGLLAQADLGQQVVDLVPRRPHLDLGVDQAGRADDLLDDLGRDAHLVRARAWPRRRSPAARAR